LKRIYEFLTGDYSTTYDPKSYKSGTDYVPYTGLFGLHKGEAVIPEWLNSAVGGAKNALGSSYELPSYKSGIDFVPYNMIANIHRGEAVLTEEENRARLKNDAKPIINVNITIQADIKESVDIDALAKQLGWKVEQELRGMAY